MLDLKGIGENIRRLRIENNYSQEELASKLYVSRQAISSWEIAKTIPTIDNIVMLKDIFNINIDDLLLISKDISENVDNYFKYHSRDYIILMILNNEFEFNLIDNFYRLSNDERLVALKNILTKRIKGYSIYDFNNILGIEERMYINKLSRRNK